MSNKKNTKKKNKLKRQLKKIKERVKPGQTKLLKKLEGSGKKIVVEPSGAVKMSDVITTFSAPLLEGCNTDDDVKNAIRFSIIIWNAAIIPEPERKELIDIIIKKTSIPDHPDYIEAVKPYIDMLIKRKEEMFPDIDRAIIDCQFSGSGSKLRLDIASSL
jgi:hypothetical protein